MEHQNQIARRLRSDPARLAGGLAVAASEGVTSRGRAAAKRCGRCRRAGASRCRRRAEAVARSAQLHRVAGLCRFLIRPGVSYRHLASHVLGRAARALGADFEPRYGYRPWLPETFVDEAAHTGASLRTANWVWFGETSGRGRQNCAHARAFPRKAVYLHPLDPA